MPMKWTPDNDQLLLLLILKTSALKVDTKAVADSWPQGDDVPTARAISERLVKLRTLADQKGSGSFAISTTSAKATTAPKKTATPRKAAASTPRKAKTQPATPTSKKRKVKDEPSDDEDVDFNVPLSELKGIGATTPIRDSINYGSPTPNYRNTNGTAATDMPTSGNVAEVVNRGSHTMVVDESGRLSVQRTDEVLAAQSVARSSMTPVDMTPTRRGTRRSASARIDEILKQEKMDDEEVFGNQDDGYRSAADSDGSVYADFA